MNSEMAFNISLTVLSSILVTGVLGKFSCYTCQGGPDSHCGDANLPIGWFEDCQGPNAQCYFTIKWFQKTAIRLIDRRCWTPPANSTITDYCKSFNNTVGELKHCRTCKTHLCNNDVVTCGKIKNPRTTNYEFGVFKPVFNQEFCSV